MSSFTIADRPVLIYLDSSVLIDYCWDKGPRHDDAVKLIEICSRYRSEIQVHVSKWTKVETHGVIYDKILAERDKITYEIGIPRHKRPKKAPRTYFPAKQDRLEEATKLVNEKYDELESACNFHPEDPDDSSAFVMQIVEQLSQEGAIYPADSLHLAISIRKGCRYFVGDDIPLLDILATDPCRKIVQRLLRESLHHPKNPPMFEGAPLQSHSGRQRASRATPTIFSQFRSLGFT